MYTTKPGSQYIASRHVARIYSSDVVQKGARHCATVGNGFVPASSELRDSTYCEPGFTHDDMMRDILTNKGIVTAQIILITPL